MTSLLGCRSWMAERARRDDEDALHDCHAHTGPFMHFAAQSLKRAILP